MLTQVGGTQKASWVSHCAYCCMSSHAPPKLRQLDAEGPFMGPWQQPPRQQACKDVAPPLAHGLSSILSALIQMFDKGVKERHFIPKGDDYLTDRAARTKTRVYHCRETRRQATVQQCEAMQCQQQQQYAAEVQKDMSSRLTVFQQVQRTHPHHKMGFPKKRQGLSSR